MNTIRLLQRRFQKKAVLLRAFLLVSLLLLMQLPDNLFAQTTVTIGSGTNTGYLIPVNSNYGYTYSQQIVLQSEIATAGQITKIRFYMVGGISLSSSNNWTIYLGHTTKTTFSSTTDWVPLASLTQVYSGTIAATPVAGWYEITFTGTFIYNNTDNLVVAVDENASGYNGSSSYVRIWTTPVANRAMHYRSDGTNPDPASPPTASGRLTYMNQMQLDIAPPPSCLGPTGLSTSNITSSSATVNWTASTSNPSGGYDIYYSTSSTAPTAGTTPSGSVAAGVTTYNMSSLSAYTTYYVWVRSNCGGGDLSTWAGYTSFTTLCGAISSFPWTENFDGVTIPAFPNCWFKQNGDWVTTNNGNSTYDADARSGTQFLRETYSATNEYIWTPGFALTSGTSYDFSFWWAGDTYAGWAGDIFYNTAASSTGASQLGASFLTSGTTTTKTYAQVKRSFVAPTTETYYFAIRVNEATGSPWYLSFDDFRLELSPNCLEPTALNITNTTTSSASINWTASTSNPSGGYDIYYSTSSTAPTAGTTPSGSVAAGITTYNMSSLSANTTYYVWVRSNCGGGDLSTWAGYTSFFTGYCIPPAATSSSTYISNFVTTGGQSNISNNSGAFAPNGYIDYYSSISASHYATGTLGFGVTIVGGTAGIAIYVDWNNDLDFSDSGETVYTSNAFQSTGTTNSSFAIPSGASIGDYRMRVVTDYNSSNPAACSFASGRGEMEDYKLSVVAAPVCSAMPTALTSSAITTSTATISWTAASPAPGSGYEYYYSTSSTAPTAGTTPSGSTAAGVVTANLSGLSANTTYYFWVRSNCNGTDKSGWAGSSNFYTGYCTPSATSVDGTGITNVTFGLSPNIVNNTTAAETNNYGDYSAQIGDLQASVTSTVSITFNTSTYDYNTRIWIDLNNDLDFVDAGEQVYSGLSGTTSPNTLVATFTIPGSTSLGNHRMRIGAGDSSAPTPCTTGASYTCFEDYTINVTAAPACADMPSALTSSAITYSTATISWTAASPAPASGYEYYYSTSATAPTAGTTPSGSTAAGVVSANLSGLSGSTMYYFWVRSNCNGTDKSGWAGSANFTTACAPASIPYNEPFATTTTPSCYNITGWTIGSARGVTGNPGNNMYKNLWSSATTGQFNTLDIGPVVAGNRLYIDYKHSNYDSPYGAPGAGTGSFQVQVSTDYGSSYATIATVNNDASTAWRTLDYDLTTYAGQNVRIRIVGTWVSGDWDYGFDNIKVETPPACAAMPTALTSSAITSSSATISWTAASPAPDNGYEYYYSTSSTAPNAGTTPSGSTAAGVVSANLSGLLSSTTYYFWVRSNCNGTDKSNWAGSSSFATPCPASTIFPWTETFDATSTTKACWRVIDGNSDGVLWALNGTTIPRSGQSAQLYTDYNSSNQDYLISPQQDLGTTPRQMRFWIRHYSNSEPDNIRVKISTTGTAISNFTTTLLTLSTAQVTTTYTEYTVNLSSYTGLIYIAFAREDAPADGWYIAIDDVTFENIPTCFTPTGVNASAITNNSATISWTASVPAPANGYDVYYSTSNTAPDDLTVPSATVGAGILTYNISGLTGNTTYYVWVRGNCGDEDYSTWTSSINFTTQCDAISAIPWSEGFEAVTIPAFPSCWYEENGDWVTTNNANSTNDADAHTGTKFLRESWTATNEFMWTPGFELNPGTSYDFTFWWAGDTYSGWTGDVFMNTAQSSTGATQMGSSFLASGTTTTKTYAKAIRTFVAATNNPYYFAIRVNEPSGSPWYLSFDDFSMTLTPLPGVASVQTETICSGSSTLISSVGFAVDATVQLQWEQSADGSTGWADVTGGSGATSGTYTTANLTATIWYRLRATNTVSGNILYSNVVSVTVNPQPQVSVGGPIVACSGYTVNLTANTIGGAGTLSYQWQMQNGAAWTNVGTNSPSYTTPAIYSSNSFRVLFNGSAGCIQATSATHTITVDNDPVITTFGATTICPNYPTVIGVNVSTNYGGPIYYQWYSFEQGIWKKTWGQTSSTFTAMPPATKDYRCEVTVPNSPCAVTWSEPITVTVVSQPYISTHPVGTTMCAGGSHTMNVVSTGGLDNTYQWQSSFDNSNWMNIAGATTNTYLAENVTVKTYYRCKVIGSNFGCSYESISKLAVININADPAISITGNNAIMPGGATTLTATVTGGLGTLSYQWQSNNGSGWNNIVGATAPQYTANPGTDTDYRCLATYTGIGCDVATSNVISVTIDNSSVVINTYGETTICAGSCTLIGVTVQTSYTTTIAYQWYYWDANTWKIAYQQTAATLNACPPATRSYRCRISTPGAPLAVSYSDPITVTVIPALAIITQPTGANICSGGSHTLMVETTGGAQSTYQWQSSADQVSWHNIPESNTNVYYASNLLETSYYRCMITGETPGCTGILYSKTVYVRVYADPSVVATGATTICYGASATLTAAGTGGYGTMTYQWQYYGNAKSTGQWLNIPGANAASLTVTPNETTEYRCVINTNAEGCDEGYSNSQTVTVVPAPYAIDLTQSTQINPGESVMLSITVEGGQTLSYQWQYLLSGNWSTITGATSSTLLVTPTTTRTYRVRVSSTGAGCSTFFSDEITITVGTMSKDEPVADNGEDNNLNPLADVDMNLYPNPFREQLNLSLSNIADGEVVVELYDITGNKISRWVFENQSGSFNQTLNLEHLAPAMYMIQIQNGGNIYMKRSIKN